MSYFLKIIPYFLYLLLLLWGINDPFFWDTTQLGSKHAHFYFESGLIPSFLPDTINSGHIPTFGYYLAICWTVFGKTLMVSHLAMLPFILGIVLFTQKLVAHSYSGALYFLSILVILSDPTLVAQIGLVSPDLALICFFLGALYYQKMGRSALKAAFLLGLVLISMRGMFLVFAFFIFEWLIERKSITNFSKSYLPAILIAVIYFVIHYFSKGWFAFHSDSPWGASFSLDSLSGMLKKPLIIIWRLLDFNRWIIFVLGLVFAFRLFKADRKLYLITSELYLLGIISIIFCLTGILFSGLTAHRYFLPMNILIAFYFLRMIKLAAIKEKSKKAILISTILILWTGHFLIYPAQIDQGWDASLAHKPYFELRAEMKQYLSDNGIDPSVVCTAFPDLAQGKYYSLDNDESKFHPVGHPTCEYVLLSNVHNDIEPNDFESFNIVKQVEKHGVWYKLLKKR